MSQYRTGFVDVVNGSANVQSNGTTEWLANVQAGDMFVVDSDQVVYEVGSVTDNLNLILSTPYAGASENNAIYTIARNFTPQIGLPTIAKGDIETAALITRAFEILDTEVTLAGQLYIDDLLDVIAPTPTVNDVITWDGSDWISAPAAGAVPGEPNTTSNSGAGIGLAQAKVGVDLPFKTLIQGSGITLTDATDTVTFDVAVVWGDITGTISNQGDLQGELNAKEDAFSKNTAFNKDFGGTGASSDVARADHDHIGIYEPSFTKNTAFNKDFGTINGTVAQGNHLHTGIYEPANNNIQNHISQTDIHTDEVNLTFMIEGATNKTYYFTLSSPYAWTIDSLVNKTTSGTVTAAIKIDGVDVTGLSAVTVTSIKTTDNATAANNVAANTEVTVVLSAASSPVDTVFTLKGTID